MRENYDEALRRVLVHEGGYANHPEDPGGATMRGVTQRVYNAYRKRAGQPFRSVREITPTEIRAIYRTQYADKIRFDDLPAGLDYAVLDGAVNSGPAQSIKWLQRALGVSADGVIGNVTLGGAKNHPDPDLLIRRVCDRRLAFCKALKTWKTFGLGWSRRIADVKAVAQAMNDPAVDAIPRVAFAAGMNAKATVADANLPKAPTGAPTAGAGAGVVAATIEGARDQLTPYAGVWSVIDNVLLMLTVLAVIVAVGAFGYGIWATFRKKQIASHLDLDTDVQPDSEDIPYDDQAAWDEDPLAEPVAGEELGETRG